MKKITFLLICILLFANSLSFAADKPAKEAILKKAANFNPFLHSKIIRKIKLPKGYHEGLLLDSADMLVNNGKGISTWVIDLKDGKLIKKIKPVGRFSEGIAHATDEQIWITDWDSKKIHLAQVINNNMIENSSIDLAPAHPTGIVEINNYLYVVTWERSIFGTKYYLLKMDKTGALLNKIRITDIPGPSQITWDGKNMWVTSWFSRRVYKIDIDSWEILGYFHSHIKETTGITWDGANLWLTGTHAGLYQVDISSGK